MVNYLYDHLDVFRLLVRCSDNDCYERMIDCLVDIDVKYTVRFMQCTGRSELASGRANELMLHMLASAYYSGLFETIRHDMSREDAVVSSAWVGPICSTCELAIRRLCYRQ